MTSNIIINHQKQSTQRSIQQRWEVEKSGKHVFLWISPGRREITSRLSINRYFHICRSNQSPDQVHIADKEATFIPKTSNDVQHIPDKTVYTTQGELNIADPFQTHQLQSDITSAKLAEAEAASAFETFEPGTPLSSKSASIVESNFTPKISSAEVYSTISSPTAQFESTGPSAPHESSKYETAAKGKVFGGQDTSADSMKHSNEDPFKTGNKNKPRQAKWIIFEKNKINLTF